MKSLKIISILLLVGVVFFASCKKDAGEGGKATVTGTVTYKIGSTSTAAAKAFVHIAYGTTAATTTYNQTILAGDDGKYTFTGLQKGDYFISADYTDANGANYTTAGFSVTINDPKGTATVDIPLQ